MIYTSYFAKIKTLPPNIIPISICGKAPDWYSGRQYKKLAPKYDFFMEWKQNHNNDFYIKCFNEQVLNRLDVFTVYDELYALAGTSGLQQYDICLLCYEKPSDFCHRHLVSDWFNKNGIACEEWNQSTIL
jgi:hypothetical protein